MHTTANGFNVPVVQYLVEPMLIAKRACGAVSAAARTASHIKLKNQMTYLLLLNTARTRKKKRRDVAGMLIAYIQEASRWSSPHLAIGAADFIKEVSWEYVPQVFAK